MLSRGRGLHALSLGKDASEDVALQGKKDPTPSNGGHLKSVSQKRSPISEFVFELVELFHGSRIHTRIWLVGRDQFLAAARNVCVCACVHACTCVFEGR